MKRKTSTNKKKASTAARRRKPSQTTNKKNKKKVHDVDLPALKFRTRREENVRFSEEQIARAIVASAGVDSDAARIMNVARSTITSYKKKYPNLQRLQDEVIEHNLDIAESQLQKGIRRGDRTFVIFYLKTKGKNRGYVEGLDVRKPVGERRRPDITPEKAEQLADLFDSEDGLDEETVH